MTEKAKQLGNKSVSGYGFANESSHLEVWGMSLREYFAGLAMQGLLTLDLENWNERDYAIRAVKCADALLEELSKTE